MEIKNAYETDNLDVSRNIIEDVEIGSIADELEIETGDILLSINKTKVKDVIDYKFMISDDYLLVEIEKLSGEIWELEIEKDYNEDLGIIFTNPLIDKAKSCKNKCMFCFIDQLPPNMRNTLYFKDDDSRLSFLQGNFITLTNMSDDEIDRIIKYKLSPINVSIHTTNPELRIKMLKNKNAGKVYEILKRFHQANLEVNCQIVLVPEVNDGEEFKRTIKDLADLYPTVKSVAVVPTGITKYRDGLENIKNYNKETAIEAIKDIEEMQKRYLDSLNTRFVFASDEFYCLSKTELPEFDAYEGFPQYENGVGLMKSLESEIDEEILKLDNSIYKNPNNKYIIATGTLAFDFISSLVDKIKSKFKDLNIKVIPIENNFFGKTITVSGLVTGGDLIDQLKEEKDIEGLIIPSAMLKRDENIFLDNITLDEVEEELKTKVYVSEVDGKDLINLLIKEVI